MDNNILKLDSAFDATARLMNNPQSPAYTVRGVVEQMKGFDGRLTVQTMFLRGECDGQKTDNTTEEEVSAWLRLIEEIRPRQVMVYSLDRDTRAGRSKRFRARSCRPSPPASKRSVSPVR